MKLVTTTLALSCLLFASCTKKSSSTPGPAPATSIPSNGWKLGATSYNTAYAARIGTTTLTAFDAIPSGSSPGTNTCNVFFSSLPTAGGTYTIVQYPGPPLTTTQIGVTAGLFATSTTYYSTGSDAITATVTVTGGKVKVEIPSVWVKNTTGADSMKLTGTIIEQ